jgi:uncharacterized membrane protein
LVKTTSAKGFRTYGYRSGGGWGGRDALPGLHALRLGGGHSICSFGADFSCDLVNQSPYAAPFGIPLSVLGLVFFAAVIAWLIWYRGPQRFMPLVAANVFGLSFGLVLTGIEIFILGSICLFCEASKVLMLLILVVTAYAAGRFKEKFAVSWVVAALLIGLGFGAVVAFGAA